MKKQIVYGFCWCIAAFFETVKCPLVWLATLIIVLFGMHNDSVDHYLFERRPKSTYEKLDRIEQKIDTLIELGEKWKDY